MKRAFGFFLMIVGCLISGALYAQNSPCPSPTAVTLDSITTYGVTISWTSGGTETLWELVIGDSTYYPTTNSYTTNSLRGSTQYIVSLRAICAPGDTSAAVLDSFS
ncbi:MAG: hypothetical protein II633_00915, partial [Bacteroidales bacterium]|nr:hypothetical protein [Bacteroidales bacterium]